MGLPPGTGSRAVRGRGRCGGEETGRRERAEGRKRTGRRGVRGVGAEGAGRAARAGEAAAPGARGGRFRTSSRAELGQNLTTPAGRAPTGPPIRRHYLMPVVAKPLTRNRWPNRNTRNSGISETTDIA